MTNFFIGELPAEILHNRVETGALIEGVRVSGAPLDVVEMAGPKPTSRQTEPHECPDNLASDDDAMEDKQDSFVSTKKIDYIGHKAAAPHGMVLPSERTHQRSRPISKSILVKKTIVDEGICRTFNLGFDDHVGAGPSQISKEGLENVMTFSELSKPISVEKTIADEGKCRFVILDFDKHVDAGLSSLKEREGLGDVMTPSELLKPISVKNIRLIEMHRSETEQESNLLFKTATNPGGTATAVIDRLEGAVKETGDGSWEWEGRANFEEGDGGDWENKKEKNDKKGGETDGFRGLQGMGGANVSTGEDVETTARTYSSRFRF